MKLDRYDIAMVNGVAAEDSRPLLQQVHLRKGRLEVADGFMLITRDAEITPEEKNVEVLIPAKILKTVKAGKKQQAILTVDTDKLTVQHQDEAGQPIDYNPTLSFQPHSAGAYPNISALFPKDTTKRAVVTVSVRLLKKLLSCMPDDGRLRLGITEPNAPVEFECSNMDRPFRGMIMPMFIDWEDFQWYREPEESPTTARVDNDSSK